MIKFRNALHNEKGFTLIELLVVVIIIGILAAVALPNLMGASDSAKDKRLEADYRVFASALEVYYNQNGGYPVKTSGNLTAVTELTTDNVTTGDKAVLKAIPADPWNGAYTYEGTADTYLIKSSKADDKATLSQTGVTP